MSKKSSPYRFNGDGLLLLPNGSTDVAEIVIQTRSKSNSVTIYTTYRWAKSQLCSCDCPGWTRRAERSCVHTKVAAVATENIILRAIDSAPMHIAGLRVGARNSRRLTIGSSETQQSE